MKKHFLFLAAALAIIATAACQSIHPKIIVAPPETAGFSSDRLTRIDTVLQEYADKKWMTGAVALVVRDGKIVYYKSFGVDDIDTKKPMPKDGIFRIASQSKAITSVAVMMLYEEGRLFLDDPISKYIPEFKKQSVIASFNEKDTTYTTVPAKREVTIRDLLTHTSGIEYAQIGSRISNAIYFKNGITSGLGIKDHILADDIKKLGGLPLMHQPGEKWTYGLNTDVLGRLVEVVSGMRLDVFFKNRIFDPLGMKDTYFYLPADKQNRLVNLYLPDSLGNLQKFPASYFYNGWMLRDYPKENGTYFSGAAGLSSTIMDYAIFLQMLLNGGEYGGRRILSRNSVRMMTMNQIGDLYNIYDEKFGLGFALVTEKKQRQTPNGGRHICLGRGFCDSVLGRPQGKNRGAYLQTNLDGSAWRSYK